MLADLWCLCRFFGAPAWFGDWYHPDGIRWQVPPQLTPVYH